MELLTVASVVVLCNAAVAPKDCTVVSCVKNTAKLEMKDSQLEGRADCDHGLYDEKDLFVFEANKSGVMYHSCQRVMYWKIVCHNKKMDIKVCFRGVNDTSSDLTASSNVGSGNQLRLEILIPVLVLMIGLMISHII